MRYPVNPGRRKCASLPRCLPNYRGLISISAINCIGRRRGARGYFISVKRGASFCPRERGSSEFLIRPKKPVINVTNDSCCSPRRKRLFPRGTKSKLALGERGAVTTAQLEETIPRFLLLVADATNHKGITCWKKLPLAANGCTSGYPILSNRRETSTPNVT